MKICVLVFIFVVINTFRVDALPQQYQDHLLLANDLNDHQQHNRRVFVDETRLARQGYPINPYQNNQYNPYNYNPYGPINAGVNANAAAYANAAANANVNAGISAGLDAGLDFGLSGGLGFRRYDPYVNQLLQPPKQPSPDDDLQSRFGFLNGHIGGHLGGYIGGQANVNAAAAANANANAGFYGK